MALISRKERIGTQLRGCSSALLCHECGEIMRYCYNEYGVALWVCPVDGTRVYITSEYSDRTHELVDVGKEMIS